MAIKNLRLSLACLAAVVVVAQDVSAQAPSEESPVIALEPTPHPAGCADFTPTGNGTWKPKGSVRIRNMITVGPSASFSEAAVFAKVNIAKWLKLQCERYKR